jgi:hypothetical protein
MDLTISFSSTSENSDPVRLDSKTGPSLARRVERLKGRFAPPVRRKIAFDNGERSA